MRVAFVGVVLLVALFDTASAYWGPKARGIDWANDPWVDLKNRHLGERCIYVGNGPSLNKMDFSFMEHFDVIMGVNKIFMGFDRFNWKPNYYATTNMKVIEQARDEIIGLDKNIVKFVRFDRWEAPEELNKDKNFVRFHSISQCSDKTCKYNRGDGKYIVQMDTCATYCNNCFCDAQNYIVEGNTITYVSMQIMKHMGCKTLHIIGVDHNFVQEGDPNTAQHMQGADPNHFDPSYFANMTWDLADLESSEKHYGIARTMYEANPWCGTILDATVDGKLQIYDKVDYKSIAAPKVTIIATPRAFEGEVGERQVAALHRWLALDPRPHVILLGDAPGAAEAVRGLYGVELRRSTPTLANVGVDAGEGGGAEGETTLGDMLPLLNGPLQDATMTSDVVVVTAMENFFAPDFTQVLRNVWHATGEDPKSPSPKNSKFVMMGKALLTTLPQARKSAQSNKCNMKGFVDEYAGIGGPVPGPTTTSPYVVVASSVIRDVKAVPPLVWSDKDLNGSAQMLSWFLSLTGSNQGASVIDGSALVKSYLLIADSSKPVPHVDTHSLELMAASHNVRALGEEFDILERARALLARLGAKAMMRGLEPSVKITEARTLFSTVIHPALISLNSLPCILQPVPNTVSTSGEHSSLRTLSSVELNCHKLANWQPMPGESPHPAPKPKAPAQQKPKGGGEAPTTTPLTSSGAVITDTNTPMVGGEGGEDEAVTSSVGGILVVSQIVLLGLLVVYRKKALSWGLWVRQRLSHFCGIPVAREVGASL